ncbi:MAG: PaaI family thioesterase [Planctomycetes bacterium]|nr:PaaI family thioesterase [Planctomycetota bacterium]
MSDVKKPIMLPWSKACFVCGEENHRGMRSRSYVVGEWIELPFEAPHAFAGWRTVIHGGLVATVLDEVMTWAAIVGSRKPCFAASFSIRMLRPLAPGTRCVAKGKMVCNRKRIFHTEGLLTAAEHEEIYARSEGRYMIVPKDKMDEFRNDFQRTPECHDISDVLSWGQ